MTLLTGHETAGAVYVVTSVVTYVDCWNDGQSLPWPRAVLAALLWQHADRQHRGYRWGQIALMTRHSRQYQHVSSAINWPIIQLCAVSQRRNIATLRAAAAGDICGGIIAHIYGARRMYIDTTR